MARKIWQSMIATATTAVCLVIGSAAHAAVYYQSDFDPFNFSVKAIFEIDKPVGSSCLASSDGWNNANGISTCTATLYSVVATLVDGSDIVHIPFVSPSNPYPNPDLISKLYIQNHQLAGIEWNPWFIGDQTTTGNSNGALNGTWSLQFQRTDLTGPPFDSRAFLYQKVCADNDQEDRSRTRRPARNQDTGRDNEDQNECRRVQVAFADMLFDRSDSGFLFVGNSPPGIAADGEAIVRAAVPEPGSLALLVGALGAGWLTRRRKTAA